MIIVHLNITDASTHLITDMMSPYHKYGQALRLDIPHNNEILGKRRSYSTDQSKLTYSTTIRLNHVQVKNPQTCISLEIIASVPTKEEWLLYNDV